MLKFWCRNWYWGGLLFAIVALAVLIVMWESLEVLQKLLIANFIALTIHQAEEYGWPGGEPMIMNYALQESDMPDRFPLNQLSAMVTNDLILVLVYFLPIFFPNVIWLGLVGMIFGIMQFFMHGIMTNIKMKGIYNPGLGAVVFLHIPIGCYYIWYVSVNGLATSSDWVVGILLTLVAAAVLVGWMTYVIMATRNTEWVFDKKELARFDVVKKLECRGVKIDNSPGQGTYYKTPLSKIQKRLHPRG